MLTATERALWFRWNARVQPVQIGDLVLGIESRIGYSKITKAGPEGEPFGSFGADAGVDVAVWLRSLRQRWFLRLTDLPADHADLFTSALHAALETSAARPRLPHTRLVETAEGFDTPVLRMAGRDRPPVSVNTRKANAKAANRLRNDGYTATWAWERPAGIVSELLAIQVARHGKRADPFTIHRLMLNSAYVLTARLFGPDVRGAIAAFAVCYLDGPRCWVYMNSVSPAWEHYSVGTLLNAELVSRAYAWGLDVDWGTGVQRYKLSGGAEVVPSQRLIAWSDPAVKALQTRFGK